MALGKLVMMSGLWLLFRLKLAPLQLPSSQIRSRQLQAIL